MDRRYWKYLITVGVVVALCVVAVLVGTASSTKTKVIEAPPQTVTVEKTVPTPAPTPAPETQTQTVPAPTTSTSITKVEAEECYQHDELGQSGSERCVALLRLRESELPDNGSKAGSYTDEKGYEYKDNQHETYCSDSPYSALPTCE